MRRYPIFIQDNDYSSGAYCVKMILKYHHLDEEVKEIKKQCKLTFNEVTLSDLVKCFEYYNIETRVIKDNIELLKEVKLPCIISTDNSELGSFVVLYKINKKDVILGSTKKGIIKLDLNQFELMYGGECLEIKHVGRPKLVNNYYSFNHFLMKYFRSNHKLMVKSISCSIVVSISTIISSFYFQILIKNIKDNNYMFIVSLAIGFMLVNVNRIIIDYLRKKLMIFIRVKLNTSYVNVIRGMEFLSPSYFKFNHKGEILAKIDNLSQLREFLIKIWTILFVDIIYISSILVMFCFYDFNIMLITISLIMIASSLFVIKVSKINFISNNIIYQTSLEYLSNILTIKQYSLKKIKDKVSNNYKAYQQEEIKKELVFNQLNTYIELALQLLFIIIVFIEIFNSKNLNIGRLMMYYILIFSLFNPLVGVISMGIVKDEIKVTFERYKDILSSKVIDKVVLKKKITEIVIDHISYGYSYKTLVFEYADLVIDKSLYLRGNIGSGKTTLLRLIMGDDNLFKGDIRINGISIKEIELNSLYQRIAYLDDKPNFFNESLRFNILLDDTNEFRMLELLRCFGLSCLIKNLDEVITSDGGFLSLGQQQIVMLIRALIKQPDVLILDGAINGVDEKMVNYILKYLDMNFNEMIVIIVSQQTNIVNGEYNCAIIEAGKITS